MQSGRDAGDKYVGLDRFGRVIDHGWSVSGTPHDRYLYTYDRNSNRLSRANPIETALGEAYAYDDLNQLTSFARGVVASGTVASPELCAPA